MGELGFETDTGRSKRGDGDTAWTALAYEDTVIAPGSTITTPALVDPTMSTVKGLNGNTVFEFFDLASAVNYLRVVNATEGSIVTLAAQGSDPNINIGVSCKGGGAFFINGVRAKTILDTAVVRSGASYTLQSGDDRTVQEFTNGTAVTVTVPTNAMWAAAVGSVVQLHQYGVGQVTITPASGVAVNALAGANKISGQYGTAFLRKRATDEWELWGDITT